VSVFRQVWQKISELRKRVFGKRMVEGPQSSYSFDGVVHALKEHDPVARMHVHVCNWFLQSVYEGEVDTQLLFFCHEAGLSLRGEVNSQNIAIGVQKIQDLFMNSFL
jgi:hypothetical protein